MPWACRITKAGDFAQVPGRGILIEMEMFRHPLAKIADCGASSEIRCVYLSAEMQRSTALRGGVVLR